MGDALERWLGLHIREWRHGSIRWGAPQLQLYQRLVDCRFSAYRLRLDGQARKMGAISTNSTGYDIGPGGLVVNRVECGQLLRVLVTFGGKPQQIEEERGEKLERSRFISHHSFSSLPFHRK